MYMYLPNSPVYTSTCHTDLICLQQHLSFLFLLFPPFWPFLPRPATYLRDKVASSFFMMKLSFSACKQARHLVNFHGGPTMGMEHFFCWKDKVIFVMGATGTGKSRLAIDLATRFPAEVVNSDKMQVFIGLDRVTNKVTEEECRGVPHHLLSFVDPNASFTSADFCHHASMAVDSIITRDRLPIIAGGSNSYIEALVMKDDAQFQLRYECCFLWVDVALPVLHSFVAERVDKMVQLGLVDEVKQIFDPATDYSQGIRCAIGVPELDQYLRSEPTADRETRRKLLEEAIVEIKENTCLLTCRQLQKIHRLYSQLNWRMHRVDATEVLLKREDEKEEAWESLVVRPSAMIVDQFLNREDHLAVAEKMATASVPISAVAGATR